MNGKMGGWRNRGGVWFSESERDDDDDVGGDVGGGDVEDRTWEEQDKTDSGTQRYLHTTMLCLTTMTAASVTTTTAVVTIVFDGSVPLHDHKLDIESHSPLPLPLSNCVYAVSVKALREKCCGFLYVPQS